MAKKTHGRTASGEPITDELVKKLAGKQKRVSTSTNAAPPRRAAAGLCSRDVESVRLDPELRDALADRAQRDRESTSAVIRKALRAYLGVS